ncbi:uncharacterized protein C8Q71DRAFT_858488 [Rhodofomes roseus]|uniref:Uncharacterized protein n=1 Tax=Rhodofomes roseus TaxID=34475 RepID=A0ABQ8KE03_9APHY|nr:uncharacterized protein C8Q71DRAFT_858488 [Rhodofomes roseus]KAH9835626.1 hypothetical protein C8Q71DRAFT_858488 [Rhodofomes roseus]
MAADNPPYYILVSHSNPLATSSTTLSHPVIEYHYADDSPHSLLPQYPGERVLVIDHDPNRNASPVTKSLSSDISVTNVKITGAAVAGGLEEEHKMYILETTTMPEELIDDEDLQTPHILLARFKQRNTVIRQAFDYPEIARNEQQSSTSHPTTDASPQL